MIVRPLGAEEDDPSSVSSVSEEEEEESMSGTMPEAVTTRGISRLSRPNEDGSPEASSRRLE